MSKRRFTAPCPCIKLSPRPTLWCSLFGRKTPRSSRKSPPAICSKRVHRPNFGMLFARAAALWEGELIATTNMYARSPHQLNNVRRKRMSETRKVNPKPQIPNLIPIKTQTLNLKLHIHELIDEMVHPVIVLNFIFSPRVWSATLIFWCQ